MDNKRLFFIVALSFLGYMLWNAWQTEYGPASQPVPSEQATQTNDLYQVSTGSTEQSAELSLPQSTMIPGQTQTADLSNADRYIKVHTDVFDVVIDKVGGNVVRTSLKGYPTSLDTPNDPVVLLNAQPDTRYVAISQMIGDNAPGIAKTPVTFSSAQNEYTLSDDKKEMTVSLDWKNQQGMAFKKQYTFYPEQYLIDFNYKVNNTTSDPWFGSLITKLGRKNSPPPGKGFVRTYFGASVSTEKDAYQKVKYKDMVKKNLNLDSPGGWIAMQQHYFLSSWIPAAAQTNHYFSQVTPDNLYLIGTKGPTFKVLPGDTQQITSQLFIGPELPGVLKQIAPHLDMTVDYGWLWFISDILFWIMQWIHQFVANWGWTIVLVTCLIRLCFFKLSAKSFKSMIGMRKLQPKMLELKKRYGKDKQKMSQATMELYRKEKVNPLGGCLPILVQIPVFIALYWVIIESVALRQAPFILWIHDLSVKDPFYILPLIMGVTIFIQQKLSPPPPDPTQAKIMMYLPIVFTIMFLNFPSGLVLYWVVNNTLSITQQALLMKKHGELHLSSKLCKGFGCKSPKQLNGKD